MSFTALSNVAKLIAVYLIGSGHLVSKVSVPECKVEDFVLYLSVVAVSYSDVAFRVLSY